MTSMLRGLIAFTTTLSLFALFSCGKDGPTEPPAQVPATINLSSYEVSLTAVGQMVQITATVLDQESKVIPGATVTWSSSNPNIARVGPDGTVTAASNGSAQITASFDQARATASVSVRQEPARIAIIPESATLTTVGETVQLEAAVYDRGDTIIPGEQVVWTSSHPAVATVGANGLVTAVSSGITQVAAASGTVKMLASVSVVFPPEAFSITLNISSATLTEVGQTLQLAARVYDIDGEAIQSAPVTWSSSNPAVAKVDETGLVTAVFNGTTQITATSGDARESARISVDISGTGPRPSVDREALIAFYNETGGRDWTNRSNWVSNTPIGTWYGVTADDDGRVVGLRLRDNNLSGSIPADLRHLDEMKTMDLGSNQLTGGLPPELGQLLKLAVLSLDGNQLTGSIPAELGDMINLESLNIGANRISGGIPPALGRMGRLKDMHFHANDLTGGIPPELGQLTALVTIRLDNNRLSGVLSAAFGQWTRLTHLGLHDNQLSGTIPPEFGQLTSLVGFELHNNQLTGGVPSELGNLTAMRSLQLQNNRGMAGPLPLSLTGVSLNSLSLDSTQLCVPPDAAFQTWLARIENVSGVIECSP
ncbi:MAG: hypothetical protein F4207_10420 [Gemmatimonadetes bacterium]|nr:hypothetical protein [Gemmatimonadota bacterium]MYA77716.1 hypothetical protein [Gemmatimonadota bacterium]MYG16821.1 hypothetical protein [Gemmatimonadota bacterium]MYH19118.1 hypothetical protein [Gemmatimonadota bacterium]